MMNKKIFITQPLLPDLNQVKDQLQEIWDSKHLTNMGVKHNLLEAKLKEVLKTPNISLFNNGTIALMAAIAILDLPKNSQIITTPFTFAATPHCASLLGHQLVFCDIESNTMTIDADKIETLITEDTSAILAVHVYGFPCQVDKIDSIAKKYNLKVIYDAAHAFATEIDGKGIATFGDITMFSFHATKLFNTLEGGALAFNDVNLVQKINRYRNFGIVNEETILDVGLNGKMNEVQAAIGLLNLDLFEDERLKRTKVKSLYYSLLKDVDGITIPNMPSRCRDSNQYLPIIIEDTYPLTRNELYNKLKEKNIFSRKYFYPLCSDFECYNYLPSASIKNLPIANKFKNKVLCLPYYGNLDQETIIFISSIIKIN